MNILMINFPAEGHVNPTLGMVKGFVERGDHVHYITTEKFKARLEGVGAVVHLQKDWLRVYSPDPNSAEGLNNFLKVHIQTSIDTLTITRELAKQYDFDLVFFDKFGAGELVRDYLGIPGVSSSASFLMPDIALKRLPLHPDSEIPFEPSADAKNMMTQLEKTFGVRPKSILQFMTNRGDLQIVYTSRHFQPNSESFGDENIFIGPSFPKREGNHHFPIEDLADEQVIYISMGTVLKDQEAFINTCIDAFIDFNGKVIIAAGERADFAKIKSAPDHIRISPYVPQLEVLQLADVFITHGGMNSVNEAVHHHVPLVVMPHDKDQPMVAQRLKELGAGYRLSKQSVTAEKLREAVQIVLSDDSYREGIKKIDHSFQKSGGVAKALKAIDEYVEKSNQE